MVITRRVFVYLTQALAGCMASAKPAVYLASVTSLREFPSTVVARRIDRDDLM